MDPRFQTSFIPKKPIVTQAGVSSSSTINLFSLIATTLFIISIALAGGAFFYKGLLVKQIEANKATLERAKGAFEPELIEQIIRLDTRIETSKKLLASHLSITPFFDLLSNVTLRSVRFKDFSFSYLAADKIQVEMKGQAESYSAVALQSDLLNTQKNLKETIISDMALEPLGTISFKIETTIDPSLVLYSEALSKIPPPEVPAETETETTSNTQSQ